MKDSSSSLCGCVDTLVQMQIDDAAADDDDDDDAADDDDDDDAAALDDGVVLLCDYSRVVVLVVNVWKGRCSCFFVPALACIQLLDVCLVCLYLLL